MGKSANRKRKHWKTQSFDAKWNECFSKLHELKLVDDVSPTTGKRSEYLARLKGMKEELNGVKSRLNDIDIVKWHKHTKSMHLCGKIVPLLMRHINAELVTQAWAKFYTILSCFDLFKDTDLTDLYTVHLCEAPGSFVTSLNHYLACVYGDAVRWKWTATTLNPYHEENTTNVMIDDDRFIIETLPNWDFGADFTGNIMNHKNMIHLKRKLDGVKVDLVTADGSLDCSENPGEQETCVCMLLLWETITGLDLLREGGSLVLKMFTMFESFTLSLLYLLHSVFRNVTFVKPGPSKPGNSEVYVVCEHFLREVCVDSDLYRKSCKACFENNPAHVDVLEEIPFPFLSAVVEYAQIATSRQIGCITENLKTFNDMSYDSLDPIKTYLAKRFLKEFAVYPIEKYVSSFFVMKDKNSSIHNRSLSLSYKRGSLNDRASAKEKTNKDIDIKAIIQDKKVHVLLQSVGDKVEDLHDITYSHDHVYHCVDTVNKNLNVIIGKKASNINSSCFLSSVLLKQYMEARQMYKALLRKSINECSQLTFHHEMNKINECYPSFGLLRKKTMKVLSDKDIAESVEYFSKRGVQINGESETGEDIVLCIIDDYVNESSKTKTIKMLQQFLAKATSSQSLLLRLDGLPLTNFWHGIFLLLSHLFRNVVLLPSGWTKDIYYIMYYDCTGNQHLIDQLNEYFYELHEKISELDNNNDILHVVDIYLMMHSKYRAYMAKRVGYLARELVDMLVKLCA